MGGGDLNLKKSWHPNTLKNQEKVWKAEQHKKDEDHKIEEMKKEIHEERMKEDLMNVAHKSGVLSEKSDKLKWMYKAPAEQTSREEYLLGRKIDKTLEMMDEHEAAKQNEETSSKPVYIIEHEVAPEAFLRRTEDFQVDLKRKILEDPLYQIRQKEEDAKAAVLSNPIKVKNLQKLLENVKTGSKNKRKKKDKKKKVKKEKKKKKRKRRNSSFSDSESSDDEYLQKSSKKILKEAQADELYRSEKRKGYGRKQSFERTNRRKDSSPTPARIRRRSQSKERSFSRKRQYERSPIKSDWRSWGRNRSTNEYISNSCKKYSGSINGEDQLYNDGKYSKSRRESDEYLIHGCRKRAVNDSPSENELRTSKYRRVRNSQEFQRSYKYDRERCMSKGSEIYSRNNRERSTSEIDQRSSKRYRKRTKSPSDHRLRPSKINKRLESSLSNSSEDRVIVQSSSKNNIKHTKSTSDKRSRPSESNRNIDSSFSSSSEDGELSPLEPKPKSLKSKIIVQSSYSYGNLSMTRRDSDFSSEEAIQRSPCSNGKQNNSERTSLHVNRRNRDSSESEYEKKSSSRNKRIRESSESMNENKSSGNKRNGESSDSEENKSSSRNKRHRERSESIDKKSASNINKNRDKSDILDEDRSSFAKMRVSDRSESPSPERRKRPQLTTTQRTEDEMARLRNIMMEAAKRRDKERKLHIEKYKRKEERELEEEKNAKDSFRTLSHSSLGDTMESSIRSRAGKCQGKMHMDSNFLRK